MSQVKNDSSLSAIDKLTKLDGMSSTARTDSDNLPPSDDDFAFDNVSIQLPSLAKPMSNLPLEIIVEAIAYAVSRQACKQGLTRLEGKNQQQKEVNDKVLDKLKDRLKILEKKEHLSGIRKVFDIIGLVVAVIAAVALIASGAGAVAGVGAIIGIISAASAVAGDFSKGKYSISGLVTSLAEHMGADKKTAQKWGMGVEIGVALLGAVLCLGGGAWTSYLVKTGQKTLEVSSSVAKFTMASDVASSSMIVTEGAMSGVGAFYAKEASDNEANQKELSAILENIKEAKDVEFDLLQTMVESSSKLMEDLMTIINDFNASQTAILTATPKLA